MGKQSELVDIEASLVHETGDAFCIRVEEDTWDKDALRYWVPKSQTEWDGENTFTMPEWLATDKGLT